MNNKDNQLDQSSSAPQERMRVVLKAEDFLEVEYPPSYYKAIDLAQKVFERGREYVEKATNLQEFMSGRNLMRMGRDYQNFEWIFQMQGYEEYSLEDYLEEYFSDENQKRFEKESHAFSEMYRKASSMEDRPNQIKIVLKRVRWPNGRDYEYRAVGIFPNGAKIEDPFSEDNIVSNENSGIFYFNPMQACTEHSCDDLFKKLKEEGTWEEGIGSYGYIGYIDPQAIRSYYFQRSIGGSVEYQDPVTGHKDNPSDYLRGSLTGVIANETDLYRIPKKFL